MTNLMQQLQQWADEEGYDFEGRRLKTPYGWIDASDVDFMVNQRVDFIKKDYRLRHGQMEKLMLVLDGTIQVWRPVEHYKPKDNEPVLLYDPTHTDQDGEPLTTVIGYYREEDGEFHRFEIYRNAFTLMSPTHYLPLPNSELVARLKGGE